jgi:methylenetetrahydrofolate dehydrogenase (NADP+)/methenyltetrahydrofolate cyclohydrolase
MTILIDGIAPAKQVKQSIAQAVAALRDTGVIPTLAVVLATTDASVRRYANAKLKNAEALGISLRLLDLGEAVSQDALSSTLTELSADPSVHGILLESPLAPGLSFDRALDCITPWKDVDGLTPANLGHVAGGNEAQAILPATPQACIELAEQFGPLSGKNVAVVGRGRTVGRPLLGMLLNRHATVTVCHTRTRDLAAALAPADVVFTATGRAKLITGEHVRPEQVVIDAGINVVDGQLMGDVDAESVKARGITALTPVPGGVGPLTSAIVFRNLLRAIALQPRKGQP